MVVRTRWQGRAVFGLRSSSVWVAADWGEVAGAESATIAGSIRVTGPGRRVSGGGQRPMTDGMGSSDGAWRAFKSRSSSSVGCGQSLLVFSKTAPKLKEAVLRRAHRVRRWRRGLRLLFFLHK